MSESTRSKWVEFLTWAVIILTSFQGMSMTIPIESEATKILISAAVMYAANILTGLKQYLASTISNQSLWPTLAIFLFTILGGLVELIDLVDLPNKTEAWIRFIVTFLIMCLNIASKRLYPSQQLPDYPIKYKKP